VAALHGDAKDQVPDDLRRHSAENKEQNDFSVFQCWGKGDDGRIYLIDMVRGKWEAPELLVIAKAFWDKHKAASRIMGTLRQIRPEDKSSGTGLIQQLAKQRIPVAGIQRGTDKVTRAMDVVPQIQAGNVMLPDSAPWLSDLLSEATGFLTQRTMIYWTRLWTP